MAPLPESAADARRGGDAEGDRPEASTRLSHAVGASARQEILAKWRDDDPVGVLLVGSLRLRDGSPADASISAIRGKERKYASATEGDSFALLGLRPGDWEVTLGGESVVESQRTVTIADDAVQHRAPGSGWVELIGS